MVLRDAHKLSKLHKKQEEDKVMLFSVRESFEKVKANKVKWLNKLKSALMKGGAYRKPGKGPNKPNTVRLNVRAQEPLIFIGTQGFTVYKVPFAILETVNIAAYEVIDKDFPNTS